MCRNATKQHYGTLRLNKTLARTFQWLETTKVNARVQCLAAMFFWLIRVYFYTFWEIYFITVSSSGHIENYHSITFSERTPSDEMENLVNVTSLYLEVLLLGLSTVGLRSDCDVVCWCTMAICSSSTQHHIHRTQRPRYRSSETQIIALFGNYRFVVIVSTGATVRELTWSKAHCTNTHFGGTLFPGWQCHLHISVACEQCEEYANRHHSIDII